MTQRALFCVVRWHTSVTVNGRRPCARASTLSWQTATTYRSAHDAAVATMLQCAFIERRHCRQPHLFVDRLIGGPLPCFASFCAPHAPHATRYTACYASHYTHSIRDTHARVRPFVWCIVHSRSHAVPISSSPVCWRRLILMPSPYSVCYVETQT